MCFLQFLAGQPELKLKKTHQAVPFGPRTTFAVGPFSGKSIFTRVFQAKVVPSKNAKTRSTPWCAHNLIFFVFFVRILANFLRNHMFFTFFASCMQKFSKIRHFTTFKELNLTQTAKIFQAKQIFASFHVKCFSKFEHFLSTGHRLVASVRAAGGAVLR